LEAALHAAFTLVKKNRVPVTVTQHLDFDVARAFDEALDEHTGVAKQCLRLGAAPNDG
jgi:hypothetical protein